MFRKIKFGAVPIFSKPPKDTLSDCLDLIQVFEISKIDGTLGADDKPTRL